MHLNGCILEWLCYRFRYLPYPWIIFSLSVLTYYHCCSGKHVKFHSEYCIFIVVYCQLLNSLFASCKYFQQFFKKILHLDTHKAWNRIMLWVLFRAVLNMYKLLCINKELQWVCGYTSSNCSLYTYLQSRKTDRGSWTFALACFVLQLNMLLNWPRHTSKQDVMRPIEHRIVTVEQRKFV